MSDLAKFATPQPADVDAGEVRQIPMRDGFQSEIRIFQPTNPPAKKPLIVVIHGGG